MSPPRPLVALARSPRPTDIAGVITRLHAIEEALPPEHGVVAFNRLYRWTTENIDRAVTTGRFEEPAEMAALDVRFADLYFDAVDAWATGAEIPGAWAPLLERGDDPDVSSLRFALAGMHAHINRDLSVAVAISSACEPTEPTPQFRDYALVNTVLDETSDEVRHQFLPSLVRRVDEALGELDDRAIIGLIGVARRAAWEAAQILYPLREHPRRWRLALAGLDTAVGMSARALLLDPELPRVASWRWSLVDPHDE